MKEYVINFVINKTNANSVRALVSATETHPVSKKIKINFVSGINKVLLAKSTIVAFSFMSLNNERIIEEITQVKKVDNEIIMIAGGPHPSGAPEDTIKMGFDYCFAGESEDTFLKFLDDWTKSKLPREKIIRSSTPVDITKYPAVSSKFDLFGPIEISRGCPFGCYFCQTTRLFGSLRHRTIPQIVKAIQEMVRAGHKNIRFITPNLMAYGSSNGFKPNLGALEEMLSSVRKVTGVNQIFAGTFPSEIRPEQITEAGLKIIGKYCDNDNIIIGAQTGSDRLLRACHRGHTSNEVMKAVEMAIKIGFKVNVDFIFGMPEETETDEEETMAFIKKLIKYPQVKIHGHFFLPLPGTVWGNKKPRFVSPRLREFLKQLRQTGREYGEWEEQENWTRKNSLL